MHRTEAQTRQEIIDRRLELAGWDLSDPSQVTEELDIDLTGGRPASQASDRAARYRNHQFVDYALLHNGRPAAVVEAKRTSKDARAGKEQALQYAENLKELNGGALPLVWYTNGHDIYYWESDFYPPVKVYGFPSRADLEWLHERIAERSPLSVEMIDTQIVGRDYQIEGIRTILEQLEQKRRKFLLVMATGTGKTRVATALVDVLTRARWAKRVLFLVDRIALRNQALDAFKEFMPPEPRWPERGETTFQRNRRIYVTTYPTMLNLIQGGTERDTWISPYFFDVIIADESHRSIYNVYRQVVDYFAGIKLGLTATPRDHVEHDTFKLFDCAPGDPSFAYSYEEAIEHDPPYLCNFEVLKVRSKFQLEGIKGRTLPPEIQEKLQAEGKDVADIDFEGTDLEHKVTNAGTNGIIVREFMEECIKDPDGVLPGKTIFFAISKAHARRLQELFDQMYPEYQGRLARVLVSEDSRVYGKGGLLDQFRNQDFPRVAISVDMLDTGVDVREVVNLVFAKPVLSYVKFWQMIGRGTRVLEEDPNRRKPWCPAKDRFLIIDCWGNFDYFKMNPEGREPGKQVPVPVQLFRARLDKLEAALAAGNDAVRAAVIEDLREDIAGLPSQNVIVSEAAGELDRVSSGDFWRRLNEGDLGFLRTAIAPLMRTRTDIDFKAARFATDVTEYATLVLAHADPHDNAATKDALRDAIVTQVDELPATNIVLKEEELIERVRRESWWDDATDDDLRDIARRLGPLMKYRQSERDPIVKLNLADVTVLKESIEFGPKHERLATAAYRERVERAVRELVAEVPALQKLQNGQDVSDEDIEKLAAILAEHDPYVTEELLRKIYDNRKARFVDFMRHILGVGEVENWSAWVTSEFDRFIAEHTTFGTLQLRLIHTLKTFVLQTRRIDKPSLIKAPFTQVHPKGIRGVFSDAEIEEILEFGRGLVA